MASQAPGQVPANSRPPVAENLKVAQKEARLTNDELARRINVSPRLLARWRAGSGTPSWPNILKLAEVLDREPSWFYNEPDTIAA